MDITTFSALALACAPLVHPATVQALVAVESSFNPHAIGGVGGVLDRQPRSRAEALATARQLRASGWNFSVGLAQINQSNFERFGLTTDTAFDPCENLRAMQAVHPGITQEVYSVLGVHNSVNSRQSYGGTAPDQVRAQVARWKEILA